LLKLAWIIASGVAAMQRFQLKLVRNIRHYDHLIRAA